MSATYSAASSAVRTSGKTMPSAPRSSAGFTQASSHFGTRTSGAQPVPAVAATMAEVGAADPVTPNPASINGVPR